MYVEMDRVFMYVKMDNVGRELLRRGFVVVQALYTIRRSSNV